MENLKKILSVILVFIMVLMLPVSAYADGLLYLCEDFEGTEKVKTYTLNPKKSKAEVVTDGVAENFFVHLENKDGLSDCFIDFEFGKCAENVVLEFDINANVLSSRTTNSSLLIVRDSNNFLSVSSCNLLFFKNTGMLVRGAGNSNVMNDTKKVYHVAYEMNLKNDTYIGYVDGMRVANMSFGSDFEEISLIRFYLASSDKASVMIDNIKFYEGTSVRNTDNDAVSPLYKDSFSVDMDSIRNLDGKTAVQGYSGNLFYNNNKTKSEYIPYNKGDETFLSVSDAEKILGKEIISENGKITIDDCDFFTDSYYCIKNGEKILLEYVPEIIDGKVYLPVEQTAKILGKYTQNDLHGLIVVSDSDFLLSESVMNEVNDYMFHKRYTKEKYKELFDIKKSESDDANFHPRLLVTQSDFDRIRNDTSEKMMKWKYNSPRTIQYADYVIKNKDILEYKLEGIRLLNVSSEAVARIMALSFAYQMTFEGKYLNRATAELDAVCNFDTWNAYVHFLDAGEMCFAVAIGYDWLYDFLTDEQKIRYETKIKEYALLPAYNIYYDNIEGWESYFWRESETNWNGVCNGGIACGAIAIWEKDSEFCSDIVSKAARSLEYALYAVGPDGSWKEGIGYLNYYLSYLTRFLATSDIVFGTDLGFFDFKGMDKLLYYRTGISSAVGTNNFHDSSVTSYVPSSAHYFSNKYNNPDFSNLRISYVEDPDKIDITGASDEINVTDIIWCKNFASESPVSLPYDLYYRDIEVISMRENYTDKDAMFTSFHGGSYEGAHDHYDAGTFVYDVLGERWAIDLGSGNYDIGTHETNYHTRTEGHNAVVINPSKNAGQDISGVAKVEKMISGEDESLAILNLSSYYTGAVNSYKRAFYAGDKRRSVCIYDEIDLKNESEVYFFMHTKADIISLGNNEFLLSKNGKSIYASFEISDKNAVVGFMDAVPLPSLPVVEGQTNSAGVKKLYVKSNTSGLLQIILKLSPANEDIIKKPVLKKIDELSVSEIKFSFSDSGDNSLFGRNENDSSVYSKNLALNVYEDNISENERLRISFYKAFSDFNYAIAAFGRKDGKINKENLGNLLSFSENGIIKLFDKEISVNENNFMKNKWYKIDLYLNFSDMASYKTTVDLYIDNIKICENFSVFDGHRIDALTSVLFDGCYIDDYNIRHAFSDNISEIKPSFGDRNYDKNMVFEKGVYFFHDENYPFENTSLSGNGIKSYIIKNNYLILTTSEDEEIYAPLYTLGEKISEKANTTEINISDIKYDIFTVKGKSDNSSKVIIGNNSYDIKKDSELSVTFYKNSGLYEIHIGNKFIEKAAYNPKDIIKISEGGFSDVFIYSGGKTNDKRISDIKADNNKGSFKAESIKEISGQLILAFYKDNKLIDIKTEDITVYGEEKEYTIEKNCNDYDEAKAFFMDLSTLKPYK